MRRGREEVSDKKKEAQRDKSYLNEQ